MSFEPFFGQGLGQDIIKVTGGVLVEYRGQESWMHCETPTFEVLTMFAARVQGVAKVLIGQTSCFQDPELQRKTLITVDGDDWLVGDWGHPGDGEEIIIALTESPRD